MSKALLLITSIIVLAAPAALADNASSGDNGPANNAINAGSGGDSVNELDKLLKAPLDKTLQGHAESDVQPHGSADGKLSTTEQKDQGGMLNGKANDDSAPLTGLQPLAPREAPRTKAVLQGGLSASGVKAHAIQDPDSSDNDVMLEWDRWRNRFLRAVQLQVQAGMNHPDWDEVSRPRFNPVTGMLMPQFPVGTEAWFYVEVTPDRRIKHLEITQSSGYRDYDRAVMQGVRALEGTSLLTYPARSHRELVSQEAGVRTSTSSGYEYRHFGDIEHYRE